MSQGSGKRKWSSLFGVSPTRVEVNLSRHTDPSAPSELEKVKTIPPKSFTKTWESFLRR